MATAAAAVIAKARRDIVSHFMQANATSAGSAVAFEPARLAQRRQFAAMRDAGVLKPSGQRFWLDLPRYDEWTRTRRRRAGFIAGGLAIAAAVLVAAVG